MANSRNINFITLAAGKGTRMNSNLPKVMQPIAGLPMIKILQQTLHNFVYQENIIVTAADSQKQLAELFAKENIKFVTQQERLGTGHAVQIALEAEKQISGIALILYGDTPFITSETIEKLIAEIDSGKKVAVVGFTCNEPNQYGRLVTENDQLMSIVEYKDASEQQREITLCNSGIMALDLDNADKYLAKLDNNNAKAEYYLTDLVAIARDSGDKAGFIISDAAELQGVNNKTELAAANKYFFAKQLNKALAEGVTIIDPQNTYIYPDCKFGKDVTIEPFCVIGRNCVVADNVLIRAFSHLEQVKIADNVVVGPYARLRPGTELEADAKIGNFVEIKKSQIGKGSKVNHLSYIGDSQLGEQVNIGAGTITCNYDGYQKYQTKIADQVFVGSNTALVAPINVGKNSVIAAGSVVTNDIPEESVTIARATQENIAGGAKKFHDKRKK